MTCQGTCSTRAPHHAPHEQHAHSVSCGRWPAGAAVSCSGDPWSARGAARAAVSAIMVVGSCCKRLLGDAASARRGVAASAKGGGEGATMLHSLERRLRGSACAGEGIRGAACTIGGQLPRSHLPSRKARTWRVLPLPIEAEGCYGSSGATRPARGAQRYTLLVPSHLSAPRPLRCLLSRYGGCVARCNAHAHPIQQSTQPIPMLARPSWQHTVHATRMRHRIRFGDRTSPRRVGRQSLRWAPCRATDSRRRRRRMHEKTDEPTRRPQGRRTGTRSHALVPVFLSNTVQRQSLRSQNIDLASTAACAQ